MTPCIFKRFAMDELRLSRAGDSAASASLSEGSITVLCIFLGPPNTAMLYATDE
jgi:hypothetical protein